MRVAVEPKNLGTALLLYLLSFFDPNDETMRQSFHEKIPKNNNIIITD